LLHFPLKRTSTLSFSGHLMQTICQVQNNRRD
jgi:hypothetical protein